MCENKEITKKNKEEKKRKTTKKIVHNFGDVKKKNVRLPLKIKPVFRSKHSTFTTT